MLERKNNIASPHMATCKWILDNDRYKHWNRSDNGILWIKGKPGAGKSTMMKYALDRSKDSRSSHLTIDLYFFFYMQGVTSEQKTCLGMLRALMYQLYEQNPSTNKTIKEHFAAKRSATIFTKENICWQLEELKAVFLSTLIQASKSQKISLYIDALDEATPEEFNTVNRYLIDLERQTSQNEGRVKVCISCRRYPDPDSAQGMKINIDELNSGDIALYVRDTLTIDCEDESERSEWKLLEAEIVARASGVFRWASLVVPIVSRKLRDGEAPEDVKDWLKEVPKELGEIYEHILTKMISETKRAESSAIMQWIMLSIRPLTVCELRIAVSVYKLAASDSRMKCTEAPGFVKSDGRMKRLINSLSGGLAEVVQQDSILIDRSTQPAPPAWRIQAHSADLPKDEVVKPVHQSVADFFETKGFALLVHLVANDDQTQVVGSNSSIQEQGHASLFRACLYYLTSEDLVGIQDAAEASMLEMKLPFINYAVTNLFKHARRSGDSLASTTSLWIASLDAVLPFWIQLYERLVQNYRRVFCEGANLLHIASGTAFGPLLDYLLSSSAQVDEQDAFGNTALHYAVRQDHEDVARRLLQNKAEVNIRNKANRYPLAEAAGQGNIPLARLLLDHGATTSDEDYDGSALQGAVQSGNTGMVLLLLDSGSNVDMRGSHFGNALEEAAFNGHDRVVLLLLAKGLDVNVQGGWYGNALQAAAFNGSEKVVSLLLAKGAHVGLQGGCYGTALQGAIVGLLSRTASEPWLEDELPEIQHDEVSSRFGAAQRLRDAGSDIQAKWRHGRTMLHEAVSTGNAAVVRWLIAEGADVTSADDFGWLPIHNAMRAQSSVIKALHNAGANLQAKGPGGITLLHLAVDYRQLTNVQWLLDNGAYIDCKEETGITPLHMAIYRRDPSMIELLVSYGADKTSPDCYGRSAIDWLQVHPQFQPLFGDLNNRSHTAHATARDRILRRTVSLRSERLLRPTADFGYSRLGRCLMFMGEFADATIAFEQQISQSFDGSQVAHVASICDGCDQDPILGARYICKSCPDTDLCASCMAAYGKGNSMSLCSGHDFLSISRSGQRLTESEATEGRIAWLRRIQQDFGEAIKASG